MAHACGRRPLFVAALLLAAAALAFGACSKKTRGAPAPAPGRPLADGESIGRIDPASSSTAVSAQVHVLLAVECRSDRLYVRTNVENLDAAMSCDGLQPQPAFEPYFGKQVSITYSGGQVIIENDTAGRIAIKATDPRVTAAGPSGGADVTPGP